MLWSFWAEKKTTSLRVSKRTRYPAGPAFEASSRFINWWCLILEWLKLLSCVVLVSRKMACWCPIRMKSKGVCTLKRTGLPFGPRLVSHPSGIWMGKNRDAKAQFLMKVSKRWPFFWAILPARTLLSDLGFSILWIWFWMLSWCKRVFVRLNGIDGDFRESCNGS